MLGSLSGTTDAAQVFIAGPPGSGEFGRTVVTLPNGNFVVTDPLFDAPGAPPIADVGAVYLYRPDGTLISTLRGSSANDRVGLDSVVVLANGNFVVPNLLWDNGAIVQAGAVTFGSGSTGVAGPVSSANSLVGSTPGDQVGFSVTPLVNGNYVVSTAQWDNGPIADAGAVTFGPGTTGISGIVSSANSLVGTTTNDRVGFYGGVAALSNGNYVVRSPTWSNGAIAGAGAVTFASGTAGISGPVTPANSLVGSTANDGVGSFGVTPLANGNYVVVSAFWDNGAVVNAGAVTFGSGTAGISGPVSAANSLVGRATDDRLGEFGGASLAGVTALANGNYVVASSYWDNGNIVDAGAATFGSGATGISGPVSSANSLVGTTPGDQVGFLSGVTALSNGNYVVHSPAWDNGAIVNAGAATFGSGSTGTSGAVSTVNSLVGSSAGDSVGVGGTTALSNGNYVVRSHSWDHGGIVNAGAATFGSGTSGISGPVSPANSLVGSTEGDFVSVSGVTALSDGDYVVITSTWDNGAVVDAGAVSFGAGSVGISGTISAASSLVGTSDLDRVGYDGVTALANGHYAVSSSYWDNGAIANAGAVTLGLSDASVVGPLDDTHSVLGFAPAPGPSRFGYDALRNQLVVGQPVSNRVVLQRTGIATALAIVGDTPDPSEPGQPASFTATITASPTRPTDGRVRFAASSGESCNDDTPTPTSATTADYSCTITFTAVGTSTVVAEYTGSLRHAWSRSAPEPHATTNSIFADGFESP